MILVSIITAGLGYLFFRHKQRALEILEIQHKNVVSANSHVERDIRFIKNQISEVNNINNLEFTEVDVTALEKRKVEALSAITLLQAIIDEIKPAFDKKKAIEEEARRKERERRRREEEEERRRRRHNSYSSSSSFGGGYGGGSSGGWGGGGGGFSGGGSSGGW